MQPVSPVRPDAAGRSVKFRRLGFGHAYQALKPFVDRRFRWMLGAIALVGIGIGATEALILRIIAELAGSIEVGDEARTVGPIEDVTIQDLVVIGMGATVVLVMLRAAETSLVAKAGVHPLTVARRRLTSTFLSTDHQNQQLITSARFHELVLAHATRVGSIAMASANMISACLVVVAMAVAAAIVSFEAFVLLSLVMMAVVLVTAPLNALGHRLGNRLAAANDDLANDSARVVDLATDARLFGVEHQVTEAVHRSVEAVTRTAFRNHVVSFFGPALFQALMLGVLVGLTGTIALMDGGGFAAAGTVALLALRAQMAARRAISANLSIANSAPFATELIGQIEQFPARGTAGELDLEAVESFEIRNLGFGYRSELNDEAAVLESLNLAIVKGEHLGIVGPSGSGKSTMLAVLLGLFSPDQGEILINGQHRNCYTDESLSRQIAPVLQRPRLVSGTVADNIRFFRDLSAEDVARAASDAGILDEVASWPAGIDTTIGERGDRQVSGGQAQRICIARALAGGPSLLIMDEPTSAIDEYGERLIVETLAALGDRCAAIIVSHRPSALRSCDRILTLDGGRFHEAAG